MYYLNIELRANTSIFRIGNEAEFALLLLSFFFVVGTFEYKLLQRHVLIMINNNTIINILL